MAHKKNGQSKANQTITLQQKNGTNGLAATKLAGKTVKYGDQFAQENKKQNSCKSSYNNIFETKTISLILERGILG